MSETIRAFVALNLDVASVRRLAETARRLRASPVAPPASWTAPTRMHITLKFFGTIDVGLAPAIADTLRPLVVQRPALRVRVVGITAFPSPDCGRVVVAELEDPSGDLATLQEDVEARCDALGFAREIRPYRPHVTLARTRTPEDVRGWLDVDARGRASLGDAAATELVLCRSDTARSGAEYPTLWRGLYMPIRSSRRGERASKAPPRRSSRPAPALPIEALAFADAEKKEQKSPEPPGVRSTSSPIDPQTEGDLPSEDEWD